MPRPKKIHKKKSFMFTSRHYSFIGNIGLVLAVSSFAGLIAAVTKAYLNGGRTERTIGLVGIFGILAGVTGVIASSLSLKERDIYVWLPRMALALNLLGILLWILLAAWGA